MAQFIVKQPNGKLALFSEVVDNFIAANMGEDQAVAYLRSRGMSEANAKVKVQAGINDRCLFSKKCMAGDWRWKYAIDVILEIHGRNALNAMVKDMEKRDHG